MLQYCYLCCCWCDRFPCCTSRRHVSQAFYYQFLSPSCAPVGALMSLLEVVHTHTGLPWWASLAVTTAALRTVLTFPLMAYSMNNVAKVQRLQPEINDISKQLWIEVAVAKDKYKWDDRVADLQFDKNVSCIFIAAVHTTSCCRSLSISYNICKFHL